MVLSEQTPRRPMYPVCGPPPSLGCGGDGPRRSADSPSGQRPLVLAEGTVAGWK